MRVLVVEDRGESRLNLEALLRLHRCWTDTADGGRQALDRMSLSVPDAVVADHVMPGMTGLEMVARMRQDPELAGVPVALISGLHADEVFGPGGLPAGAGKLQFFLKPFEPAAMIAWLREAAGRPARKPAGVS